MRIDNGVSLSTGVHMQAARSMAGFTPCILSIFSLCLKPGMSRRFKILRNLIVTRRTRFGPHKRCTRDRRRGNHHTIHGRAGNHHDRSYNQTEHSRKRAKSKSGSCSFQLLRRRILKGRHKRFSFHAVHVCSNLYARQKFIPRDIFAAPLPSTTRQVNGSKKKTRRVFAHSMIDNERILGETIFFHSATQCITLQPEQSCGPRLIIGRHRQRLLHKPFLHFLQ